MPRLPRKYSKAEFSHVMIKGNGGQIVFEDIRDKLKFIDMLAECVEKFDVQLHAYCLMTNHVHLLVKDEGNCLSEFMHKLTAGYAAYFNFKYERSGSLFQGRFKSEAIYDQSYYLSVLRYIHRNPDNAHITRFDAYAWSSFDDYRESAQGKKSFVETGYALEILGGFNAFYEFLSCEDDIIGMDVDTCLRGSDERVAQFLCNKFNLSSPTIIREMSIKKRNDYIREMRDLGITASQIERLTGVSRTIIYKVNI